MGLVLFHVTGEYQDVIEVDDDKGVEVGAEDVMHKSLEGGRSVGEAEGHDSILKVAITGTKSRLRYIVGVDADLVVAMAQVDLREDRGTMEAIEELINAG